MINKEILKNKYKRLVSSDRDKFLAELKIIKEKTDFMSLSDKPLLIYSRGKREAIHYLFMITKSLKKERILDYTSVSGQTIFSQHFKSQQEGSKIQDTDKVSNDIYYSDITFINLSQFDYVSDFVHSLIIEVIDFRDMINKQTVIHIDLFDKNAEQMAIAKKIESYFRSRDYTILDLSKGDIVKEKRVSKKGGAFF